MNSTRKSFGMFVFIMVLFMAASLFGAAAQKARLIDLCSKDSYQGEMCKEIAKAIKMYQRKGIR